MRVPLIAVLSMLTLTSCSGSSGVKVSHDWSGITSYVVADVNHLATVVGIDPSQGRARSLIVIPDRADDDKTSGPVIARNGSATLVIRPARSGAGIVYRVRRGDSAVTRVGHLVDRARLYPNSDGWAEITPAGTGTSVRLLDAGLATTRTMQLPIRPDLVAPDGVGHLCVAQNDPSGARILTVDLAQAQVGTPVSLPSQVGVLACPGGKPMAGVSRGSATGAPDTAPSVEMLDGQVRTLEVSTGRFDSIVIDGTTAYALVGLGNTVHLLVVDLTSGAVVRTVKLDRVGVVDDAVLVDRSLVVVGESRGASYDTRTGSTRVFALPGAAYPN